MKRFNIWIEFISKDLIKSYQIDLVKNNLKFCSNIVNYNNFQNFVNNNLGKNGNALNSLTIGSFNKTYKFIRVNKIVSENLKKDFNINLMNQTILNIFYNSGISSAYKKLDYNNQILINKIINENVEINTLEILNMRFIDIINEIREKNLIYFLKKIENKEKNIKFLKSYY